MRKRKKAAFEAPFSLAAGVVSFSASLIGVTQVKLTQPWHYVVAILAYCGLFAIVSLILFEINVLYRKVVPGDMQISPRDTLSEIYQQVDVLHDRMKKYDLAEGKYKEVAEIQLKDCFNRIMDYNKLLSTYLNSSVIKHEKGEDEIQASLEKVIEYCDEVEMTYSFLSTPKEG